MERSPFELSGGQKRRVAMAGVMAMKPRILVLDEPAAGLDPEGRDEILGQVKDYHKKTGTTVLLVSHSMEDIAKYANQVLVMSQQEDRHVRHGGERLCPCAGAAGAGPVACPQVTKIFLQAAGDGGGRPGGRVHHPLRGQDHSGGQGAAGRGEALVLPRNARTRKGGVSGC